MKNRSIVFVLAVGSGLLACAASFGAPRTVRADERAVAPNARTSAPPPEASPYGSHAHIYRPREQANFPRNLDAMRDAGLRWARTDFLWDIVEPDENRWDYSQYDRIVDEAEKRGVEMLGILGYSVPWARPASRFPEKWSEYVARTVERYKGRVRYWEVWNEEDLDSFWGAEPNPEDYAEFLKITARAARQADPDATVLFGGTSLIPLPYIERALQAGAGEAFDALCVHPYRRGLTDAAATRGFADDLAELRALLTKYGLGDRPIWITEMGWTDPTPALGPRVEFVDAVLKTLSPDKPVDSVAVFHDAERYAPSVLISASRLRSLLPPGVSAEFVDLDSLTRLDPQTTPYLYMPPNESFPADAFDAVFQYVRDGGTLFFPCGYPCYYAISTSADRPTSEDSARTFRKKFRIDVRAWWTTPEVPKKAEEVVADPAFANVFPTFERAPKADRFLGTKFLQDSDRFEPLLWGKSGDFSEPVAGIYRFDSDMKGNIAVYTLYDAGAIATDVAPEEAGLYLPQACLIALDSGVERFFVYQFQASESDPFEREEHFGLVRTDLSPKASYVAMKALTTARPEGSIQLPSKTENGVWILAWTRPDGRRAQAVWRPEGFASGTFAVDGAVEEAFDYLGTPVEFDARTTGVSDKILYLIGPADVDFAPDDAIRQNDNNAGADGTSAERKDFRCSIESSGLAPR